MTYLLPLLAGVLWAISALINKGGVKDKRHPLLTSIIYNFSALFVTLIIAFFSEIKFANTFIPYLYLIASSFFGAFGFWAYFKSLESTDISLASILNRIAVVVAVIGGFVIFSEVFSHWQILGLILVVIGIFSPGIKDLKYLNGKGSLYALFSGITFGISGVFDKSASMYFSPAIYMALGYAVIIIFLFLGVKILKVKRNKEIEKIGISFPIIGGVFNAFAFFLFIYSYTLGAGMGITNLLTQIRLPLIFFGGIIVFKEKEINNIKLIGSLLILLGAFFLQMN